MIDIQTALQNILDAVYGEEVRISIHDAIYLMSQICDIKVGSGVPTPTGYEEGTVYIDADTSDLYKLENGAWVLKCNIRGNGIVNIEKTGTAENVDTYTITLSSGETFPFNVTNGLNGADGADGADGVGVDDVVETAYVGRKHTITFILSDGTTKDLFIYDGQSGSGTGDMTKTVYDTDDDGIVDSAEGIYGANNDVLKKFDTNSETGALEYDGEPISGGHELVTTKEDLEAITQTGEKVVEAFLVKQLSHEAGGEEYSELHIHTSEADFIGLTVTAEETVDNDNQELEMVTGTFDNDGYCNLRVHRIGTYKVYVTFDGNEYMTTVQIPYFSIYPLTLSKEFAVITVTTSVPEMKGQTITATSGSDVYTGTFDTSGNASIYVYKTGNYTLSCTDTDGYTRTKSGISVTTLTQSGTQVSGGNFDIDYAIISISTSESDLYSQGFTATHESASMITGMLDSSGNGLFKVYALGDWTITASGGGQTAVSTVNVVAVNNTYDITLAFFRATITVTADISGKTVEDANIVTVKKDNITVDTWTVDGDTHTFTVHSVGTYVFDMSNGTDNADEVGIEITEDGQSSTAGLMYAHLYGFRINKSDSNPATRVEYLNGCKNENFTPAHMNFSTGEFSYGDWNPDEVFFLKNNYPAMVNSDGTEAYKLNPDDYTKKIDGTASDVSSVSFGGNAMARIDKVYLKMYEEDGYEYCYICDKQIDEDFHAYAHTREDGSEMDYIWISLFEGYTSSSKTRSIKGNKPSSNTTGANELTYAKANNPTGKSIWSTRSWSQYNLLWMLLILMGKSTDVQSTYGNGHYTGGSSVSNFIACGSASDKGRFYGTNSTGSAVKAFHIENLWGNEWDRIEGLVTNGSTHIMVKPFPPYNTAGTDYIDTGVVPSGTSGGFINECKMTEYGLIPSKANGSDSTYVPDGLWFAASCYALVGGSCGGGLKCGLAVALADAVSHTHWSFGSALSCEQPSAA